MTGWYYSPSLNSVWSVTNEPELEIVAQWPGDTREIQPPPDGASGVFHYANDLFTWEVSTLVPVFLPIEPTPFWLAAWDLLSLKKSDVLNSITDPDARYEAELQIEGRKTYLRNDPMVIQLATLLGYPSEQMDDLWLFVQANYA